jgi:AraC-like DNA-binding protein
MPCMDRNEDVRLWRAGGVVCMHGTTSAYAVDPIGEQVLGIVLAGGMEVMRGRERHRFGPGDLCAWDASGAHSGRPYRSERWEARLIVLEPPMTEELELQRPRVRDRRLAERFLALHAVLETPTWALERDTLLAEWLRDLAAGPQRAAVGAAASRRRARRDPALRRARELLCDELTRNVTLDELAAAAGVSRHRLTRLFRAAYRLPPHRFVLAQRIGLARALLERGVPVGEAALAAGFFDQSHLHRHFRRTLGITPARYAQAVRSGVQDAPRVTA